MSAPTVTGDLNIIFEYGEADILRVYVYLGNVGGTSAAIEVGNARIVVMDVGQAEENVWRARE